MEMPRGYNPIGQSAPGLPRHDAPLPGHVPGQYNPVGGDDHAAPVPVYNVAYAGPGLGDRFGIWSTRVFMAIATYLTLPLQLALYPLAGMPTLAVGYFVFQSSIMSGAGYDQSMNSAWTIAWLVLLPMTRVETGIEMQVPGYRKVRHLFRVLAFSGWFYYYGIHYQTDATPQLAALEAVIVAAPVHFILRSRLVRGLWDSMQTISWLRKA